MTIPDECPEVETEAGKAGVYKELALIELFLRKLSQQQGQASIVLACLFFFRFVYQWKKLYLELQ